LGAVIVTGAEIIVTDAEVPATAAEVIASNACGHRFSRHPRLGTSAELTATDSRGPVAARRSLVLSESAGGTAVDFAGTAWRSVMHESGLSLGSPKVVEARASGVATKSELIATN
jgi:hypothetical protein